MNAYEATNKAADYIEQHPSHFDFWNNQVPGSCGTRGCALGWIGYFLGLDRHYGSAQSLVAPALGIDAVEFYTRMARLLGSRNWEQNNAAECARGLRLYAEKYHADGKLPVWAAMLDREAKARLDSQPAYAEFRQKLVLEPLKEVTNGHTGVQV